MQLPFGATSERACGRGEDNEEDDAADDQIGREMKQVGISQHLKTKEKGIVVAVVMFVVDDVVVAVVAAVVFVLLLSLQY